MPERAQRDVRRQRSSMRKTGYSREPIRLFPEPAAARARGESQGPRRRERFGRHFTAACRLLGYTDEDEKFVAESRDALLPHVPAIAVAILEDWLLDPEMAQQFASAEAHIARAHVAARRQIFESWLYAAIDDPLDAVTADFVATIAHEQVRPRDGSGDRVKGRHVVAMVARVQAMVVGILGDFYSGNPQGFARAATAWSRRLTVHLDLLLAVYGATEKSAHWY